MAKKNGWERKSEEMVVRELFFDSYNFQFRCEVVYHVGDSFSEEGYLWDIFVYCGASRLCVAGSCDYFQTEKEAIKEANKELKKLMKNICEVLKKSISE